MGVRVGGGSFGDLTLVGGGGGGGIYLIKDYITGHLLNNIAFWRACEVFSGPLVYVLVL